MRRSAKVDSNHSDIVDALRAVGATVQPLHTIGGGCPDLLVGYRGCNVLLEVKDGSLALSRRGLTEAQQEWHAAWKGRVHIVNTVDEALFAIGVLYRARERIKET